MIYQHKLNCMCNQKLIQGQVWMVFQLQDFSLSATVNFCKSHFVFVKERKGKYTVQFSVYFASVRKLGGVYKYIL